MFVKKGKRSENAVNVDCIKNLKALKLAKKMNK